jgi:hypothetical protein
MQRTVPLIVGALLLATPFPVAAQREAGGLGVRAVTKSTVRASALATIQVHALNSINKGLPKSLVRLRDARRGRIVEAALTDKVGAYSFKGVESGNYVVELVGTDQTPIAATNLISVNAGDTVTTVVKLPFKPTMVGNLLGNRPSPATSDGAPGGSLSEIVKQLPQAAAQAIPAVVPVGAPISER